jgi:cellulose synthase/poly-beta-1,6-N-acetylglucosamine synthase-like glycosyltransferase
MILALRWLMTGVLSLLTLVSVYQWILLVASLMSRRPQRTPSEGHTARFLILIPAHNEEASLPLTLHSLAQLEYPRDRVHIVVAADRCQDNTVEIARGRGATCLERMSGALGKGAVIAWALESLGPTFRRFDALVILDADTRVDPHLLDALNKGLLLGHTVQQGHNYLANPWDSPFTRIIAVTSLLRNSFFYAGKMRLGLSGMLSGTGMCFSRQVLERYGWTAFSVGEDWEFSASLLLAGEKIYFNDSARVFATESRGFLPASTQRLRWASGRHAVAARYASKLVLTGLRLRRLYLLDAALTLVAPPYSTQATLAILAFIGLWAISGGLVTPFLVTWAGLLLASLCSYFLLGAMLTQAPSKTLAGLMLIPVFLPWRAAIEILGLLGYGRRRWVPTIRETRVPPKTHD